MPQYTSGQSVVSISLGRLASVPNFPGDSSDYPFSITLSALDFDVLRLVLQNFIAVGAEPDGRDTPDQAVVRGALGRLSRVNGFPPELSFNQFSFALTLSGIEWDTLMRVWRTYIATPGQPPSKP